MSASEKEPVHFVLRVPLKAGIQGTTIDTIDAHAEAAAEKGRVAVVKFGAPGMTSRADRIRKQIEEGRTTFLILVAKEDQKFVASQATLLSIHLGKRPPSISAVVPAYYRKMGAEGGLWFVAAHPFVRASLDDYHLASNGRPLVTVLAECRTASMLVCKNVR